MKTKEKSVVDIILPLEIFNRIQNWFTIFKIVSKMDFIQLNSFQWSGIKNFEHLIIH